MSNGQQVATGRPETLNDYLDQFDGELNTEGLLNYLYRRDDISVPWTMYIHSKEVEEQ